MNDPGVANETSGPVGQSVQSGTIHGDVHFHAPASDHTVPHQLPGAVRNFVNRAIEQDALSTVLSGASGENMVLLSMIDGTAGVGKSALAVHWAHQRREQFPDGELYVNLRGFDPVAEPMSATEALGIFLVALGVPAEQVPGDQEARAGLFRSVVHGRRILLLLDNARSAEQVRPLLPASPACLVLVTSRKRLDELVVREDANRVGLQVLTAEESNELLVHYLGRDRVRDEPEPVRALIGHCAGLPLALGIVAVRAAEEPDLPLHELVDDLSDERERLDALEAGGETGIRAVFSWSYQSLSPAAARVFRLLGIPTGPDISLEAVSSLVGQDLRATRRHLAQLTSAHLLDQHKPGRYAFHDLLRAYASERVTDDEAAEERHAALHRLLDHYLRTSRGIEQQLLSQSRTFVPAFPDSSVAGLVFTSDEAATGWWATEHHNLLAAIRNAHAAGLHVHAWQLAHTLMYFFRLGNHLNDWKASNDLAIESARKIGEEAGEAYLLKDLGMAHYAAEQYERVIDLQERSLTYFEKVGDLAAQANILIGLGEAYQKIQSYETAEDLFQRGLDIEQTRGEVFGQGYGHTGLGTLCMELHRPDEAFAHFDKALRAYREVGEEYGEAYILSEIGSEHARTSRWNEAAAAHRQSAEIRHRIGHKSGEAASLRHLGDALHGSGDRKGARSAWEHSLALLHELGESESEELQAELDALDDE